MKLQVIFLFATTFSICHFLQNTEQLSAFVYVDPHTGIPLRLISIENNVHIVSNNTNGLKSKITRVFGYRSNGCSCQEFICGCCIGFQLAAFNFSREGCLNFTYSPYDFSIEMNMLVDNEPILYNTISAKDPPPLCMPAPIPYLSFIASFCIRLFNIHTPGQNLQACLDFETRFQQTTLLILHFNCIQMGEDGFHTLKPGQIIDPVDNQQGSDIYNPVTEVILKTDPGN